MHLNPTRLAIVAVALVLAGAILAIAPGHLVAWVAAVALFGLSVTTVVLAPRTEHHFEESARIESLSMVRRAELVRGTSLRLREMKYRYSVRHDERGRLPFSTRINQIQLGFVPVIITDNETDMQGVGFVAFIHDGQRWRGPGLPCAGTPSDAVANAARHVDPLRDVEDTGDTAVDGDSRGDGEGGDSRDDPFDDDSRWDTGSGWDDDSEPGDGGART